MCKTSSKNIKPSYLTYQAVSCICVQIPSLSFLQHKEIASHLHKSLYADHGRDRCSVGGFYKLPFLYLFFENPEGNVTRNSSFQASGSPGIFVGPPFQHQPRERFAYKVIWLFNTVFYTFCLLSGQYIVKAEFQCNWRSTALLLITGMGLFVFLLQFSANALSFFFSCYVILFCPFPNCSAFFSPSDSNGSGNPILDAATTSELN